MKTALHPTDEQLNLWVPLHLREAKGYHLEKTMIQSKIDQNESPWDWPIELKQKVLDEVLSQPWNRYPDPYPEQLHDILATHTGYSRESILVGQGSNTLITLMLNAFGQHQVVGADPSFPLYKAHCRYANLPYEPWPLDDRFEYDLKRLPTLKPGGVVLFASPNNPTGSLLKDEDLIALLSKYPQNLFIADEAYLGFSKQNLAYLLEDFSNLLIVRTLSKTGASAGIRCGYMMGHPTLVEHVRKINLPFSTNAFTSCAIKALLTDQDFLKQQKTWTQELLEEKQKLVQALQSTFSKDVTLYPGHANFILLQFKDDTILQSFNQHLQSHQVLARSVSDGQRLRGCIRISLGDQTANAAVIKACKSFNSKNR